MKAMINNMSYGRPRWKKNQRTKMKKSKDQKQEKTLWNTFTIRSCIM